MACPTAKIAFPTQREAAAGARQLARLRGVSFNVYYCRHCQGYHLGRWAQDKKYQTARRERGLPVRGVEGDEDEDLET